MKPKEEREDKCCKTEKKVKKITYTLSKWQIFFYKRKKNL